MAKWKEEYEGFNDRENEDEEVLNRRQITKDKSGTVMELMRKDMNRLEFESMERQRRLKNQKYNERRKTIIKRQKLNPCLNKQHQSL